MKQKVACAILAICLLGVVFTGCEGNDIPAVDEVEQVYQENRDYIQLVVDFMINIDYNEIIINDSSGNIWADFDDCVPIIDNEVKAAVCILFENDVCFQISKRDNFISFRHRRGIRDIGGGIAYLISGEGYPDVQYATEVVPLSEERWFYFMTDYESWRVGVRPSYD